MEREFRNARSSNSADPKVLTTPETLSSGDIAWLDRFIEEALQQIIIPAVESPSPEELARRQAIGKRIDRFREAMGSIDFSIDEAKREGREGEEEDRG